MLSFSQFNQHDPPDDPAPEITENPSSRFTANQTRQQAQQIQRQIKQTAKEVERTSESDDTKQLARMLVKLTALMGLSLAQDAGDRRMLVKSLLQENE
jgi:L-lactate utilization protein LutC